MKEDHRARASARPKAKGAKLGSTQILAKIPTFAWQRNTSQQESPVFVLEHDNMYIGTAIVKPKNRIDIRTRTQK